MSRAEKMVPRKFRTVTPILDQYGNVRVTVAIAEDGTAWQWFGGSYPWEQFPPLPRRKADR